MYWNQRFKHYIGTNKVHALVALRDHGVLTQKELARILMVTPGAITGITDDLEKRGLLEKAYSTTDKRTIHLSITDQGKEELEHTLATASIYVAEMCQILTNEEKEILFNINCKLTKHLDQLICSEQQEK